MTTVRSRQEALVMAHLLRRAGFGATPNEITSFKESNSAPKLEPSPLSFFANQPSKKSKIAAKTINKIAVCHSFKIENIIKNGDMLIISSANNSRDFSAAA